MQHYMRQRHQDEIALGLGEYWGKFTKLISSIEENRSKNHFFKIPSKIKMALNYKYDILGNASASPSVELDFDKAENTQEYLKFVDIINEATAFFLQLTRTDIPYYLFVDELEVFYADEKILCRDLRMIRDILLTVKFLNNLLLEAKFKKTKIIASVRTEIINSIQRYIASKEINKVM